MRIAAFTGSFDPYTIGHDDIVRRALPLFDRIVIGVGYNEHKQYMQPTEERCKLIRSYYKNEPKIEVVAYGGFLPAWGSAIYYKRCAHAEGFRIRAGDGRD